MEVTLSNCKICVQAKANYVCPKCNIAYCSVICYKKHSQECTESFSKQNIDMYLRNKKPSEDQKSKMISFLKTEYDALFNYNTCSDLEKLPEELYEMEEWKELGLEKQLFINALNSGQLSSLIEEWVPWWEDKAETKSERHSLPKKPFVSIDSTYTNLYVKNTFQIKNPRKSLIFDLANVITSYCLALRLYNGDTEHEDSATEFCSALYSLSGVLSERKIFDSLNSSLQSILENAMSPFFRINKAVCFSVFRDAAIILYRKDFVQKALDHSRSLMSTSKNKKILMANKKLEYFMSWTNCMWGKENLFERVADDLGIIWKLKFDEMKRLNELTASKNHFLSQNKK